VKQLLHFKASKDLQLRDFEQRKEGVRTPDHKFCWGWSAKLYY